MKMDDSLKALCLCIRATLTILLWSSDHKDTEWVITCEVLIILQKDKNLH